MPNKTHRASPRYKKSAFFSSLLEKKSVHVSDTAKEENWQDLKVLGRIASCIVVPPIANKMSKSLLVLGNVSPWDVYEGTLPTR
jgi:hypothetical protein